MKLFKGITATLVLLTVIASALKEENQTLDLWEASYDVYAVHNVELKPDVDSKEFESYVIKQILPIYNKMEGQTAVLVKGDRGQQTNNYAVILTFDSLEDRNRIYPPEGGFVGDFGSEAVWEKLNAMLSVGLGDKHTDYVKVVN